MAAVVISVVVIGLGQKPPRRSDTRFGDGSRCACVSHRAVAVHGLLLVQLVAAHLSLIAVAFWSCARTVPAAETNPEHRKQ